MTSPSPSPSVYVIDVPEVRDLHADFQYNFFVPDEALSELAGVTEGVLERQSEENGANFLQYATTRAPRAVVLRFRGLVVPKTKGIVTIDRQRLEAFDSHGRQPKIIDNIKKIVSEEAFSSGGFALLSFHNANVDDDISVMVSGSIASRELRSDVVDSRKETPVSRENVHVSLSNVDPSRSFIKTASKGETKQKGARFRVPVNKKKPASRAQNVVVTMQLNQEYVHDLLEKSVIDSASPFSKSVTSLLVPARDVQSRARLFASQGLSLQEPVLDPIDVNSLKTTPTGNVVQLLGFLVTKHEVLRNGKLIEHEPLIVENPRVSTIVDVRVKYGSTYSYSIKTIALVELEADDEKERTPALVKMLVSSKSSSRVQVHAHDTTAPPPPADVSLTWDYDRPSRATAEIDSATNQPIPGTGVPGSLLIHWAFPTNSQRDIKTFQVFRRKSLEHPFELLQEYDFDDSMSPFEKGERVSNRQVQKLASPLTFFYDDEFTRESRFIYALACVDAHGLTSNYSVQFEVWFDVFKNRLEKKLISHSGAPKSYPNLYLEADAFIDAIRVSGPVASRMRLCFAPEAYKVIDAEGAVQPHVRTNQIGGSYVFQFLNLDNQKSATISVTIDDRTTTKTSKRSTRKIDVGKRGTLRVKQQRRKR